ncbi:hypothetical protein SPYCW_0184 [Sphingopyxis sp. EG6]|nr:hypothetical protein SPYCW_0184 [Sphingopyxis sp. EG6]
MRNIATAQCLEDAHFAAHRLIGSRAQDRRRPAENKFGRPAMEAEENILGSASQKPDAGNRATSKAPGFHPAIKRNKIDTLHRALRYLINCLYNRI